MLRIFIIIISTLCIHSINAQNNQKIAICDFNAFKIAHPFYKNAVQQKSEWDTIHHLKMEKMMAIFQKEYLRCLKYYEDSPNIIRNKIEIQLGSLETYLLQFDSLQFKADSVIQEWEEKVFRKNILNDSTIGKACGDFQMIIDSNTVIWTDKMTDLTGCLIEFINDSNHTSSVDKRLILPVQNLPSFRSIPLPEKLDILSKNLKEDMNRILDE